MKRLLVLALCVRLFAQAQEPKLFAPGTISTGDSESHITFTPDGRTAYFIKSSPSFNSWTIVESHLTAGGWSTPTVPPFSGQYLDADPYITRDGSRLWFISNRPLKPGQRPQYDNAIKFMDRLGSGWDKPQHPDAPINSTGNEWHPTVSDDGVLYFGSDRPGGLGATDIYRCKLAKNGCAGQAEKLGAAINSAEDEYEPLIAPDGSWLIFMATRTGGVGMNDLYISFFKNGNWTPAMNLGKPINSPASEFSPRLSPDGKYLFYSSRRAVPEALAPPPHPLNYEQVMKRYRSPMNGLLDIYFVELQQVLNKASATSAATATGGGSHP